jgi:S-adenosylmethionine synthetase
MARGYDNPMLPLRYVANMFKEQTLDAIENNLMTQKIWPYEVYPGYKMTNERRRQEGGWYSTGQGARSFEGSVIEADENTGRVTLSFRYNDYMKFVDMGVGAGRKAEDVDRAKKANYRRRYINKWIPAAGVSHRPAISMEFRHLASRLQSYCYDFYGNELEYRVLNTFEGLSINVTP